jgi:hypothetical protein
MSVPFAALWLLTEATAATPPMAEVRLGVMPLSAARLDGAASLAEHRLRAELAATWAPTRELWLEPALYLRLLGPADSALWLRAGYQFQHASEECPGRVTDDAHALDAGVAYRRRWPAGHVFAGEAGVERLSRHAPLVCRDSVVDGQSVGGRVAVLGQWAFRPPLGLFLRAALRTADHLPEIHVLPELFAGLSLDL